MVSDIQFIIVATMSGNDFPSVPPSKKTKAAIGSDKATNYVNISDDETLVTGAASAAKIDGTYDGYVPQDIQWQT